MTEKKRYCIFCWKNFASPGRIYCEECRLPHFLELYRSMSEDRKEVLSSSELGEAAWLICEKYGIEWEVFGLLLDWVFLIAVDYKTGSDLVGFLVSEAKLRLEEARNLVREIKALYNFSEWHDEEEYQMQCKDKKSRWDFLGKKLKKEEDFSEWHDEREEEELLTLALRSKNLETKLEYCSKCLDLNPKYSDALDYHGDILSMLGRNEEAIDCYIKAMELANELESYMLGVFNVDSNPKEAVELFDDTLRNKPNHAKAWLRKGQALTKLRRYEEALIALDKALELLKGKPPEADAWHIKALALLSLGRVEGAMQCLNSAIEIDPAHAPSWGTKGGILNYLGKYNEALTCFYNALEILQRNPEHHVAQMARRDREIALQKIAERS